MRNAFNHFEYERCGSNVMVMHKRMPSDRVRKETTRSIPLESIKVIPILVNLLFIAGFRIVLDWSYITCVVPQFSYLYSFEYHDQSLPWVFSWLAMIVLSLFVVVPRGAGVEESGSDLIVAALFLVSFVPTTVIYAYQGTGAAFFMAFFLFWMVLLVANRLLPFARFKGLSPTARSQYSILLVAILAAVVVFASGVYAGFRISFDLSNVYDLRLEAREFNLPTFLSYLFGAARVVIPLMAVCCLWRRRYGIFGVLILIQVLNFSFDGSKSALFSVALMLLAYLLIRQPTISLMIKVVFLGSAVCLLLFLLTGRSELISYAIRRVMLVPALLNYEYFSFFSNNAIDFFTQSLFSKLGFESAYQVSIPHVIAEFYHNSTVMSANNGLFSDAFSNLGIGGCFLMPLAYIATFRLFDACTIGLPNRIVFPAVIPLVVVFLSSSFFTCLITHGMILYLLALYLLPRLPVFLCTSSGD